jgi:recombination protein RecA
VKVVKNKVAAPFKQAEFDVDYGEGISNESCILELGVENDIVTKSGSFFSYGETRLGQGRNNSKAFLRENPDMATEIEEKIYAAVGAPRAGEPLQVRVDEAAARDEAAAKAEADGKAA